MGIYLSGGLMPI